MYFAVLIEGRRARRTCNSPRLKAGLMMFDASMAPSADPAPTIVWSSSMKRMTLRDRRISSMTALMRLLELTAVLGAGDHQREIEGDHLFIAQKFRHVAAGDLLGQAFGDSRFAHARFAKQHRVVLRPAARAPE